MQVNVVKLSSWRIPRQFIQKWMKDLTREIKKQAKHDLSQREITLAFVEKKAIRELNRDFRSVDKGTDILSFSGFSSSELGELVLCGAIVEKQAHDHELSSKEELGYLLIHGVLHLLGYDHEKGGKAEKVMFELQDRLFDVLRSRHFKG